ncbi:MAG: membrane dipeptidase [Clostridia bacterium]|nr:membrane dipeptidase [Clostridia bacterium]
MSRFPFGLCDTHCDTLTEMCAAHDGFYNTTHHISLDRVDDFAFYTQIMAIYSDAGRTEEACWRQFLTACDYAEHCREHHPEITACSTAAELEAVWARGGKSYILAVEGGKLLAGDLRRLDIIRQRGVRFFTLVWGGHTCMGGAHDVGGTLSPFGIAALRRMLEIGIVPDVSHASDAIFDQTAAICAEAEKPFFASHSNSASIHRHTRCLSDAQFTEIMRANGIVGISFCTLHLGAPANAVTVARAVDHIEHYLSLGGARHVCFGGDLDGIGDDIPLPMRGIEHMYLFYEEMARRGYSDALISDLFCGNAQAFLRRAL